MIINFIILIIQNNNSLGSLTKSLTLFKNPAPSLPSNNL